MAILPINYEFIKSVKFTRNNSIDARLADDVSRLDLVNEGISAKIYKESTSPHLLFHQSFDPGWQAYAIDHQPTIIDQYLPFITGQRLDQHHRLNNWANEWTIPETQQNQFIIIYYTPQLLETLSLMFMPIGLSWALVLARWRR